MFTDDLIARRPKGRTGLAEWYSEVFEAQRAEGLRTADVAALLEMTGSNLHYWKPRLRAVDVTTVDEDTPAACGAGLVQVRVSSSSALTGSRSQSASLEVRLPSARSIVVPRGFSPDDLRALIGVLEAC